MLTLGAIPGLAVFYLRRKIHETPRFAMAGGAAEEAEAAIAAATGTAAAKATGPIKESKARRAQGTFEGFSCWQQQAHTDLADRHVGGMVPA